MMEFKSKLAKKRNLKKASVKYSLRYKAAALSVIFFLSFDTLAGQISQDFQTWCPGGVRLIRTNGLFFIKSKQVKPFSQSDEMTLINYDKQTFKVEEFSDGLQISVSGTPSASGLCTVEGAPKHTNHAERAGQGKFEATGQIPCAQYLGQPTRSCSFGVARDRAGDATVRVQLLDGRFRFIFFENGKPLGADLTQADGNTKFEVNKEADLYLIKAGQERYEFPEAIIFGG